MSHLVHLEDVGAEGEGVLAAGAPDVDQDPHAELAALGALHSTRGREDGVEDGLGAVRVPEHNGQGREVPGPQGGVQRHGGPGAADKTQQSRVLTCPEREEKKIC